MPGPGRKFVKGQPSANPGGRPVGSLRELAELCRQHGPMAVATLVEIAQHGGQESDRIAASKVLLDRGYGKATERVELSGPDGGPLNVRELSDAVLEQIVLEGAATTNTLPR
jgi:hypothetical protein